MSVFISFNYKSGRQVAKVIARKLKAQGLDAWWFPGVLNHNQLDSMISLALANCSRCILLWTNEPMSGWQTAEISTIRHQFRERVPGGVAEECFIVARAVDVVPKNRKLPLFLGCEYVDFSTDRPEALDFSFLDATPPGLVPVTCGNGRSPRIVRSPDFKPVRGHHLIHGEFVPQSESARSRHCWIFLRDHERRLYIQQPRPTVTHMRRWAAPNIYIGANITAIMLAAADDATHRKIVNLVLSQSYGAIEDAELVASLEILDQLEFKRT